MVGRLIRERRQAKGLSQEDLAEVYGVDQRQISRWENYTTQMPREATRERLGDLLSIGPAEWHLAAAEAADPYSTAERRAALAVREGEAPWYETASDDELMARAGVTPVPPEIAAYVRAVSEFGGEIGVHAGERGHVNAQDIEDSFGRKLEYQVRHGDPLHWTRVFGKCMEPRISDGDMVYIDRALPPEPGKFIVAIVNGEQAIARMLTKVNGRFWLETLDGAPPQLVTDGVRLIGRVVYRQSVFA